MAESGGEGCGWWGGWVQAAKDKSSQAYEFMKADLTEFSNTVGVDTTQIANAVKSKLTQENVTAATEKAKQGVSTLIGGISKALVIEPEDLNDPGIPITSEGVFDRKQARLRAVQLDSATYLQPPAGNPEQFDMWLPSFALEERKGDISELLVANVEVRALYTQLVPSAVSHADFWQRYFYKVHQLEQDEQRRLLLMARAQQTPGPDHDLAWDDDDEWEGGSPPRSPQHPDSTPSGSTTTTTSHSSEPGLPTPSGESTTDAESPGAPPVVEQRPAVQEQPEVVSEQVSDSNADSAPVAAETAEKEATTQETTQAVTLESTQTTTQAATTQEATQEETTQEQAKAESASVESKSGKCGNVTVVEEASLRTRDKGELVVVQAGSDRTTPSSESLASSSHTKESSGLDDDWDLDLDVEVTAEELKAIEQDVQDEDQDAASHLGGDGKGDDWENWD